MLITIGPGGLNLVYMENRDRNEGENSASPQSAADSMDSFYKAFHLSSILKFIIDCQTLQFVDVNQIWLTTMGYERDEVIGRTTLELDIFDDRRHHQALVETVAMMQATANYEIAIRTKSGTILTTVTGVDFIHLQGRLCILGESIDITERKNAELALQQSEEKFFKAFHNSPVIMAIYDAQNNRQIEINQMYTSVFGYSREEAVGKTTGELGLWRDFMQKQAFIRILSSQERVENFEAQLNTKQGHVKTVLIQVQTIHIDGRKCFLNSMIDITELKRMEQEINRLDRLHLVGEMAASLGHEIRNPMTSVRGFLQLLGEVEHLQGFKDYFDLMIEEMDRANEIVTSFLSMSTNKYISPQLEDLNQTISGIFPLIQADATRTDKSVVLELNSLPQLMIDHNEIRQLIINLARNGLEAMPERGLLTIGSRLENSQAVLYVRDQGAGLDLDIIDKLGTPFTTTKEHGIGIGLAVCYSIAARHQAAIDFETSPTGTTFYVRFNLP